ncbi:hypothetical protein APR12_003058 [Nocardia amikacinitolerans]|uniref:hypothetical protein n=1 Tax=Nocardia amikacinitolerans TaxID=756689 RepID=UPI0008297E8C|nr:hypothetical protein [Nocardia amikacinitolerans]MCP2317705.1 hypothetical protein [Nocardia amikacinitolerans]
MTAAAAWQPPEVEVHLRIRLADMVFDYVATAKAARNLIDEWQRRKHRHSAELIGSTVEQRRLLPRLPCERLFACP